MNIRHLPPSLTGRAVDVRSGCAFSSIGSAHTALSETSGHITLTGCFQHQMVNESFEDE